MKRLIALSLLLMVGGCQWAERMSVSVEEATGRLDALEADLQAADTDAERDAVRAELDEVRAVLEAHQQAGDIAGIVKLILTAAISLGVGGIGSGVAVARKWLKVASHLALLAEDALPNKQAKATAKRLAVAGGIETQVHKAVKAAGLSTD